MTLGLWLGFSGARFAGPDTYLGGLADLLSGIRIGLLWGGGGILIEAENPPEYFEGPAQHVTFRRSKPSGRASGSVRGVLSLSSWRVHGSRLIL